MKKKVYIYPLSSRDINQQIYNPYVDDLITSFEKHYTFVNINRPSKTGIFDILKYITEADYIFFHWIEKLPEMKAGLIQTLFLFSIIPLLKLLGIKIVWTMHNKFSHTGKNAIVTRAIFKLMIKKADLILTHSGEGVKFGSQISNGSDSKIRYLPHPVKNRIPLNEVEKKYDILIWGSISPYKGIDKFLEYLHQNKLEKKYKILIAGKVTSKEYCNTLIQYVNNSIKLKNEYIEDKLLQDLIVKSRLVLFTYSKSSVLSSGVLMDSLGYGANILGPDVGAFADLSQANIITTFSNYDDLIVSMDNLLKNITTNNNVITEKFIRENSWEGYADKVCKIIC